MTTLLRGWTTERVFLLTNNPKTAQASRTVTNLTKWTDLGHDQHSVWGNHEGSRSTPYRVIIDTFKLENASINDWCKCDCPVNKKPCKHILGLLLILVSQPASIPHTDTPPDVLEWLDKMALRVRKEEARKQKVAEQVGDFTESEPQPPANFETRKNNILAGIDELELWLDNLLRHGLARPEVQTYEFWDAKAARLVDAQAGGIASWLRKLATMPYASDNWIEQLLLELARLYLGIQSFKRFDSLSSGLQADLRTLVGWHIRKEEVSTQDTIEDQWLVTGRYEGFANDVLRTQRIWLRGYTSGRDALILEFAYGDQRFDTYLEPGWKFEATLVYFPSEYPLRAFIKHQNQSALMGSMINGVSIATGLTIYSQALAANPWLPQFPMILDDVTPSRYSGAWILQEADGTYLPIADAFDQKWALLALSGGYPIQVSGEWDGLIFHPTSAYASEHFVDFAMLGKV